MALVLLVKKTTLQVRQPDWSFKFQISYNRRLNIVKGQISENA